MKLRNGAQRAVSVHLAGSDYLTGVGLAKLLGEASYISITGISFSGRDAVGQVTEQEPDVVLLDGLIQDDGVIETTAALRSARSGSKIVILSGETPPASDDLMQDLFHAGAACHLTRDTTLEDLAAALRIVHRGGLTNAVLAHQTHHPETIPGDARRIVATLKALNARDRRIVEALVEGQTNAEISAKMHLSESTVKARVAEIMRRTGTTNRVQIAVAAVRAGFLSAAGRSESGRSASSAVVDARRSYPQESRTAAARQAILGALAASDGPLPTT